MRYAKLVFVLLTVAGALVAADPFVGTWKVNPSKSKFKTGAAPKEQTVTISESGGDLDIAVKGTAADGTPISTHYTIPASGGSGKVVYTTHATLSKDGKTLTVYSKGKNPAGQTVDGTVTYDKQ